MRRGQQLIAHYRRIWQENDLLLFLLRFRRQVIDKSLQNFSLTNIPFLSSAGSADERISPGQCTLLVRLGEGADF